MSDQTIDCCDCQMPFTFTDGEQTFYATKQLTPPRRCKSCRTQRKKTREMDRNSGAKYPHTCIDCGNSFELNFELKRPAYCPECFPKHSGRLV